MDKPVLPLRFFHLAFDVARFGQLFNFQNSQKFSQTFWHKKWKSLIADFLYSKQVFSLKLLYVISKFTLVNHTRTINWNNKHHRIQSTCDV